MKSTRQVMKQKLENHEELSLRILYGNVNQKTLPIAAFFAIVAKRLSAFCGKGF